MNFLEQARKEYKVVKRSNAQHKSLEKKALKQNNIKKALYHKAVAVNQWTDRKLMSKKDKRILFQKAMKGRKKLW